MERGTWKYFYKQTAAREDKASVGGKHSQEQPGLGERAGTLYCNADLQKAACLVPSSLFFCTGLIARLGASCAFIARKGWVATSRSRATVMAQCYSAKLKVPKRAMV